VNGDSLVNLLQRQAVGKDQMHVMTVVSEVTQLAEKESSSRQRGSDCLEDAHPLNDTASLSEQF